MEHGLEEGVKPLPAGGLPGFHLADFCYPLCELLLQRQGRNKHRKLPKVSKCDLAKRGTLNLTLNPRLRSRHSEKPEQISQ